MRWGASVGPAHAGMLPGGTRPPASLSRRPRARGDAPRAVCINVTEPASAPRTRGCSPASPVRPSVCRVGPAHAGMLRGRDTRGPAARGRPRARGDAPRSAYGSRCRVPSAPRTRGCSLRHVDRVPDVRVGPAHAGMLRSLTTGPYPLSSRPRARGDAPRSLSGVSGSCRSAPRTRGCSLAPSSVPWLLPVGPAHAGMLPPQSPHRRRQRCRPRARGDAPDSSVSSRKWGSSAPRTRGCSSRCGE